MSVAFKNKGYVPRARFLSDTRINWESFVGKNLGTETFQWARRLGDEVELDLFDASITVEAVENLKNLWTKGPANEPDSEAQTSSDMNESYWINRLAFMALSGQLAEDYLSMLEPGFPQDNLKVVRVAAELFDKLRKHPSHPGTFDADFSALLEGEARLLVSLGET